MASRTLSLQVDCTITHNDGLDLLAEFMGVKEEVEELTNKVRRCLLRAVGCTRKPYAPRDKGVECRPFGKVKELVDHTERAMLVAVLHHLATLRRAHSLQCSPKALTHILFLPHSPSVPSAPRPWTARCA